MGGYGEDKALYAVGTEMRVYIKGYFIELSNRFEKEKKKWNYL